MSGGIAYVLDEDGALRAPLQHGAGRASRIIDELDGDRAARADRRARAAHRLAGGRARARPLGDALARFVKVMPRDYKRAARCRARGSRARAGLAPPRLRRRTEVPAARGGLHGRPAGLPRSRARRLRQARPGRARARLPTQYFDAARRGGAARPGRALHGLRRPVLPRGLPARQPDPRLERPRLPRRLARGARPAARHQQLPRVHRPDLPGAVRVGLRARHQRRPGDDQADRARDRRARLRRRAGSSPQPPRDAHRPDASRWSARGPPGSPSAAELNRAATRSPSTSATRGPAGCCASACPDAKLEKWIIDRRVAVLEAEGIAFRYGVDVGRDVTADELRARARRASSSRSARACTRDLEVPGRELDGVHFAMDYLYQRNRCGRRVAGPPAPEPSPGSEISAAGKRVVVVGGGDTGMDCISNALREGARRRAACSTSTRRSPADGRPPSTPWPLPPKRTLTTYALDEGGERRFGTQVTRAARARTAASSACARAA